jgi:hypothetical protein
MRFTGENGRRGTAFLCRVADLEVLVTAKHLCGDDRDELITVQHPWTKAGTPMRLMATRVGGLGAAGDVAAFTYDADTFPGVVGEVPLGSDGLVYTQDAFILGYPYGLSFQLGGELNSCLW